MRLPPLTTRVVTADVMAALDKATIEGRHVPSLALMERAGREVARRATAWWRETGARYGRPGAAPARTPAAATRRTRGGPAKPASRKVAASGQVLILAGRGNNGGDGFVAARYLKSAGFSVRVLVAASEDALSRDAAANRDAAARARIPITFLPDARAWGLAGEAAVAARGAVFLVDALLGTGSRGAPRGAIGAAIEMAGGSERPIVAVDIPSGVDASSGHAESPAIRAAMTVTLALPKLGHVLEPGRSHAGAVEVADIGIPEDLVGQVAPSLLIADALWVRSILPIRPAYAHKGSMGRVLVVGGSAGMIGAVAMTGESTLRSGAGYAVAAVPRSCVDALEARVGEVVKRGMPETDARSLSRAALDPILEEAMRADVVAIGPGASRHPETEELVRTLVERIDGPIVLDADGLNAFEGRALTRRGPPILVSPHYGEAARLTGTTIADVSRDPAGWAGRYAEKSGAVVCLKSTPMLTAAPGEPLVLNATGNPGMATAGSGDSLTGILAGFLAQGMEPGEAAAAGCFVHGLAGDVAARRNGMRGMIAGDIKDAIPAALIALESGALDER